jgi:hypothetical protein
VSALGIGKESHLVKRADSLLKPLIKDLGIEEGVRLSEMRQKWNVLFQEPLSHHISPSLFTGGELLLNVDSPVWLQELKFYKEDIIRKLSSYGVKAVRFRLGRIVTTEKSGVRNERREVKPLKTDERSFIDKAISGITDENLKVTLKTTMKKAITSGKTKI